MQKWWKQLNLQKLWKKDEILNIAEITDVEEIERNYRQEEVGNCGNSGNSKVAKIKEIMECVEIVEKVEFTKIVLFESLQQKIINTIDLLVDKIHKVHYVRKLSINRIQSKRKKIYRFFFW